MIAHGMVVCWWSGWEKLTQPEDWKRAYAELNDFEEQLQEHNNILLKFGCTFPGRATAAVQEREEIRGKL